MILNNYSASEPQFLCEVCSEAVTNPICPSCITTEIKVWLTLYPNLSFELMPVLERYLQLLEELPHESTICIKCGNKNASVCPYCFIEYVLRQLKKINANKIILNEFLEFFNFDLEHTGYSEEAEESETI